MPVTKDQAEMLANLAAACRPHGTSRWDAPGVMAAIAKVKHLALADVMRAVANAADDRGAQTPGVIGNLRSACWQDRPSRPAELEVLTAAERCGVCPHPRHDGKCPRCAPNDDHEFAPDFKRGTDAPTAARITEALKQEVKPMREPTPMPAPTASPEVAVLRSAGEGVAS